MIFPLFLYLIISDVIDFSNSFNEYGPQPRILSRDGHLVFKAAEHKNISFLTEGAGRVHINGVDLTKAAQITDNAIQAMAKYKTNFESSFEKIHRFEQILDGEDGLIQKLFILQDGSRNSTTVSPLLTRSLRRLNRRVTGLQRRVNNLESLLIKDECQSSPCKHGGTCVDLFNSFLCHCSAEWEGEICDTDVNECTRFVGTDLGCQNGARCINKPGGYECVCTRGWYGVHCTKRSNDCNSGSSTELCGHGTCVPQNNEFGYKCICDQGWTTDGTNPGCNTDVDECKTGKPPCSVNPSVECVNLPGSFRCGNCPAGYTGNGYHCTDIDECQMFNGGCSLNPLVQCINTLGSRICGSCPPGYTGNGMVCSYQGSVCATNNGGCHPLATCQDNHPGLLSYVQCICPSGYTGSGMGPNGCTPISGYNFHSCTPNPCVHGVCSIQNSTGAYVCQCYRRWTGRNCDIIRDLCNSNPCSNGGSCVSVLGVSYRCICPSAYTGLHCEEERQACGGQLRTESGDLVYPLGSITTYNHRINCAWVIETNVTKVLNITFTKFDLESSRNCQYDWLQIHDGRNTLAPSLGRFCGNQLPNGGVITSTHNIIYLWFRTDNTIAKTGFELNWESVEPVCGDTITVTSHGSIKSPGSPGNYPNNRNCYWSLSAPTGKRLLFHFFTLIIGDNQDCDHDYLEFINGQFATDPIFEKYCNTSHPQPLFSPGPDVLIHFHSDESKNYPGFQITYSVAEGIPGCGGVYTSEQGEIRSPSFDGRYPSDLFCEYKITLTRTSRIKLTFISFALEISEQCRFDHVSIYNGPNTGSPLIGRYCGKNLPAPYITASNEVLIVFQTDWSTSDEGFVLQYETVCGGKFTSPTGIIQSAGYPHSYSGQSNCIYEIIQPIGTSITLTFTDLSLEQNSYPHCIYDYAEVRDGDNENSTLIGRYCSKAPPPIISTHNYLWIRFVSDVSIEGIGFQANYTTTQIGCGGILKEKVGTISSPNHPNEYEESHNCEWILSAAPGYVVQITWMNFRLEDSTSCMFDYVEVFDNNTETGMGGSMGKFCGFSTPPMLLSSSNIVTVKFVTDRTINSDGFLASYAFILDTNVCGGNYYTPAGTIKTPNYPENYPYNVECTWVIHAEPGHQIMLKVIDFEIEYDSNCRYDSLKIRNGASGSSPLFGTFCGTIIPKLIPSHTNKIYLRFKSDLTKSLKGFKISWDSTSTGCGGDLNAPTGSIASPHYPEPYPSSLECIWKISVSAGSVVEVMITDIDLEQNLDCSVDYVEFYDGPSMNTRHLGRYCKPQPSQHIQSLTNHLTLRFVSDISDEGRGFQIQYNTKCNNTLTGFRGVVESPNFPNPYPHNLNCIWDIKVSDKNKINITFSHFNLERESPSINGSAKGTCVYDYLQISYKQPSDDYDDDVDDDFIKYDKYCGDEIPPLITLNSDHARIQFVTDSLLVGDGFRFEWQIEGCGGLLKKPVGTIMSPNYPNGYPHLVACDWQIQTEPGNSIEITFSEMDIEKDNNCGYDYIVIYNGIDDSYPELTRICHQNKPTTVVSTGNSMFINFRADGSFRGRGFYANYSSIPSKCGGTYTAAKGYIMSPNYPNNFDKKDTCGWLIDVDEHHLIELIFEDVDLPRVTLNNGTNGTFIKVYDGPTAAYPLLTTLAGKQTPNHTIISTHNHLYIEMVSNTEEVSKGFKALYRKACGARIETTGSGVITMSSEDIDYEYSTNCTWTIVAKDPKDHVSLTITSLYINFPYCDKENYNLIIYGGESATSPVLGQYCSNKIPPMITSGGSALHIVADYHVHLSASFSVYDSECGGTLFSHEASFASPGYPSTYPTNVECEWTLVVSDGNQISLNFLSFALSASDNCNTDYLEIRRWNSSGKLLGVFCNNNIPENITHVGNLWIYLKTSTPETSSKATGFLAEYKMDSSVELSGEFGVIASPLYPKSTRFSDEHTWKITVTYPKKILLTFKDFIMEDYDQSCMVTRLAVYDGDDDTATLLKTLCGTELPNPIESTRNVIFLKAYVSYRIDNKFLLEWRAIQDRVNLSPGIKSEKCGEEETIDLHSRKNATIITSPGYPNGYKNNLECQWIFSTISMNSISLYFDYINFERQFSQQCYQDYVEVFQKRFNSPDWESLGRFCNDSNYKRIDGTNLMKVKFISNRFFNGSGFSARVKEGCGGAMFEPTGFIYLSNSSFPDSTHRYSKSDCQWNVTVRSGRRIEIEFITFDLEKSTDNCPNYLMLRNGQFSDSPFLGNGKYCGDTIPPKLETTGNYLYIKYSGYLSIPGFKLKYREISHNCGGQILLTDGTNNVEITSPNYPNVPHPHIECSWIIVGPARETLRIDFHDRFDLTSTSQCSKEYVEIHDGGTEYSPLLSRFCSESPNSQFSTDNIMLLKYFTDVDEPGNGFKAEISIAKCGGILRGRNGVVQYSHENLHTKKDTIECIWRIIGPLDRTLKLTFNKFNLYPNMNCSINEYVEIYEKNQTTEQSNNYSHYGPYCGDKIPEDIESLSNEVFVKFVSRDHSLLTKGSFSLMYNASVEECGGILESDFGTIRSPVFKELYGRCKWVIKVPPGRRVTFEILDIDIGKSNVHVGGGISFFNGENFKSHITMITGFSTKRIIKSSENYMAIFYWSHGGNNRGFYGKFTSNEPTVCRGDFGQDSGTLVNPQNTSESFYCTYIHRNERRLDKTIAISIQMSMNSTRRLGRCDYAQDFIYVVAEYNRDYLARICNNIENAVIVRSPLPVTKILVARSNFMQLNYTISYDSYPCGGVINGESGTISSPNYPNKYDKSIECSWLLKLPKDRTIKLTPITINLGKDCDKSYIEIYNGNLPTKPKIGKYCHDNIPTILSQTNNLWINYKFDKNSDGTGFSLKYEPVINGCGGIFHDETRIIQTPNYPKQYPNNAECLWEIRSKDGYHINLNFISRFQIEQTDGCVNDFIQIWDWRDDQWIDVGRKCGRDSISSFNSTGDRMKILFRSNDRITGGGFQAQWRWKCGGTFDADNKERFIYSPGYPESYQSNMNCHYTIKGPPLKYIHVKFYDFVLEGVRPSCKYDNVTISSVIPARLLHYTRQIYCGDELPPDVRLTRFVYINFKTDKYINKLGFKLSYKLESCDEIITEPKMISSPSLNNLRSSIYQSYVTCVWNITAPPKKIVIVQFEQFDLPMRYNCFYDNVDIFEDTRLRSRIANLCGNLNRNLPVIKSKNNTLAIRLRSDRTVGATGFKAFIYFTHGPDEGCGGNIELSSTPYNFVAPNLRSMDCIWDVRAPTGNTIKVKFSWLSLEGSCTNRNDSDFLEIKDGVSPMSETITKLCGIKGNFNEEFITSGSVTQIRLYSSGVGQPVFRATLTTLPSPCGPAYLNATQNKQILTSPNYPNQYPDNIKCIWVIKGAQKMLLHFEDFDLLEDSPENSNGNRCLKDKLQIIDDPLNQIISDGLGPSSIISGNRKTTAEFTPYSTIVGYHQFCGKQKPFGYYTQKNSIVVKFSSGTAAANRGKGFKLEYQTIGCNRNFTSLQGRIYINQFTDCYTTITVPDNYTISLYFQHFMLFQTENCRDIGVEIRQSNQNGKLLLKACGYALPDPVFSSTHQVWIHSWNKRPTQVSNYDIVYTSTDRGVGCGGTLYNYKGRFTSPLYPRSYKFDNICEWIVKVPLGMRVAIKISDFDIQGDCGSTYVEIITNRSNVHTFCKNDHPAVIYSDNQLSLRYKSSSNNEGRGWLAQFEAVSDF